MAGCCASILLSAGALIAIGAAFLLPGVHVQLFSSSLKRLELVGVTLSDGLPDVLSCFPSVQDVAIGSRVQLYSGGVLTSRGGGGCCCSPCQAVVQHAVCLAGGQPWHHSALA